MTKLGAIFLLIRHGWWVWRAGQLRFRLETFGLYYPALPYSARFWQVSARNVRTLKQQSVAYARWVVEMERLRTRGPDGYWDGHHVNSQWLEADRMYEPQAEPEAEPGGDV